MTTRFPFLAERTLRIRQVWHAFRVLVPCSLVFAGCASVMNGRTQVVAVSSDPPGAHVFVDDEHVGVPPTFVDLPRRQRNLALRLEQRVITRTVLRYSQRHGGSAPDVDA